MTMVSQVITCSRWGEDDRKYYQNCTVSHCANTSLLTIMVANEKKTKTDRTET